MTFDDAYETLPTHGWLTRAEAELLWMAASRCTGSILEVGSYHGRSTCLLAQLGRPVYAVDPFDGFDSDLPGDEIEWRLKANLRTRNLTNVTVYRQRIEDWMARPCGFAFLDGDHTYRGTVNQIEVAQACGAQMIAIHDVNDSGGGLEVKRAVIERLGPWSERVERLAVWEVSP